MKRKIIIMSLLGFAILLIGFFSFYPLNKKSEPPLVTGAIGQTNDQQTLVIAVGNKGSEEINITDVWVNNYEQPKQIKLQLSNPMNGFVITDTFDKKTEATYDIEFKDVSSVILQPHTSPQKQLKKLNHDNLNKNAEFYGLSIVNDKPINKMIIDYRYSGSSFEQTIQMDL